MTDMVAQDYHLEFISPEKSHGQPQKKSLMALPANEPEEPRKKRVRPLSRVASLVSLISPVKSTSIKRLGQTLQRSISLRPESGPLVPPSPPSSPPSRSPTLFDGAWRAVRLGGGCGGGGVAATPGPHPPSSHSSSSLKRRDSKLWSEMYDTGTTERLSRAEIKRQEAIFELAQGEQDLIEDLTLAKKVYHDPMLTLAIMSAKELEKIFGMLETFIPLHADLLAKLKTARKDDGTTDRVGHILAAWLPCLTAYSRYCSNQVAARLLLERKRGEARVHDFLQRCLESPFSRRLDLWSFLDAPRSRLVKYPLLLRGILRHTPNDHADRQLLEEAISTAAGIVRDVNSRTGESECRYFWNRLDWSDVPAGDGATAVAAPRLLSCHGELRTARGARVYVFLFERALVVTRPLGGGGGGGGGGASDGGGPRYRTRGRPIPVSELALWDLTDGDVITVGGSFRGAFRGGQRAMNMFRVGHTDPSRGQSITLKANDAFGKQRWLGCIRAAVETAARAHASPRANGAGSGWCAETEARCPPAPSFGDLGVRPESSEAPNSAARREGDVASSHPATLSTVAAAMSEPAAGDAADFPTDSCSSAEDDVSAGDAMARDGIDAPPVGSSDATPTSDATTSSRRLDAAHRSAQQCLEPQGTSETALRAAEPPRTKDVSPETLEGSELFGDTPQKDIVAVLETTLPADVQASEQVPTAAATNTQALETTTSEAVGDLHAGIRPTLLSLNSGGSSAMGSYEATLTAVPGPLRSGERNMNSIANIFCEKDPEQKHLRSMLEEQTTKL
ncbi:rho guanine nucleotide exchange factor 3-like isoform X1 [Lethenteron reissneri]|uniref:rho guanine nucleotide exchange factor 3-like isoform X1 n=1 Tax=Lethenteron reissneri TaxID=7753 RepID=UPI002AB65A31|nr:rho guanine nucleotide exchange factor 3-like isoform X1 [Lethenteron reissneri]